jgi:hypothetical protein
VAAILDGQFVARIGKTQEEVSHIGACESAIEAVIPLSISEDALILAVAHELRAELQGLRSGHLADVVADLLAVRSIVPRPARTIVGHAHLFVQTRCLGAQWIIKTARSGLVLDVERSVCHRYQ